MYQTVDSHALRSVKVLQRKAASVCSLGGGGSDLHRLYYGHRLYGVMRVRVYIQPMGQETLIEYHDLKNILVYIEHARPGAIIHLRY